MATKIVGVKNPKTGIVESVEVPLTPAEEATRAAEVALELARDRAAEEAQLVLNTHPAVAALLEELEKLPQMQTLRNNVINNLKAKL